MVNDKSLQTEELSIGQIALRFLTSDSSITLPKKIHDMLQTVLTKRSGDGLNFRKSIVTQTQNNNSIKHDVIRGRTAAIYNILCLYVFMETKDIKQLFKHYDDTRKDSDRAKRDFSMLYHNEQANYLAYMCFGVEVEHIKAIESCLLDKAFDLFRERLPSPFVGVSKENKDLSPLLTIVNDGIDWAGYRKLYQEADELFELKRYDEAKDILIQLDRSVVIKLPVVDSLRRKISMIEDEGNEAWEYLQKIYN